MNQKEKKITEQNISTDPFGMYTGKPDEAGEQPIQDADDL